MAEGNRLEGFISGGALVTGEDWNRTQAGLPNGVATATASMLVVCLFVWLVVLMFFTCPFRDISFCAFFNVFVLLFVRCLFV